MSSIDKIDTSLTRQEKIFYLIIGIAIGCVITYVSTLIAIDYASQPPTTTTFKGLQDCSYADAEIGKTYEFWSTKCPWENSP